MIGVTNNIAELFDEKNKIGKGAYSMVFSVRERATNHYVALKQFLNRDPYEGIPITTIKEIIILKLCKHPNIIDFMWYDNVTFNYFTMPLYQSDLKNFISTKSGFLGSETIRDISYQILMGVYYMHSIGMIHRDIKPQNILIDHIEDRYNVVLSDIGLGRRLDAVDNTCPKTTETCTLWYRAPEILLGDKNYYYGIDIWSVGCVIAEMMFKRPLFPGDSEIDQLYKIFLLLGTPIEDSWPGVYNLSNKFVFPEFDNKWDEKFNNQNSELSNLVSGMLRMNPLTRFSCVQSLQHPVFNILPKYIVKSYDNIELEDSSINRLNTMIKWKIKPIDIGNQLYITPKMREILINWLFELFTEFHLLVNSYIRAQVILDRYMTLVKDIVTKNYQLIGMTCLLLAAKLEEISPPLVDGLIYMSDNSYTHEEVLCMEKKILKILELDMYFPITTDFLTTYAKRMNLSKTQKKEVEFLLSYVTFNIELQKYHPSVLMLCVCIHVSGQTDLISDYSESPKKINTQTDEYDIEECMKLMTEWLGNGGKKNLVRTKSLFDYYKNGIDVSSKYL